MGNGATKQFQTLPATNNNIQQPRAQSDSDAIQDHVVSNTKNQPLHSSLPQGNLLIKKKSRSFTKQFGFSKKSHPKIEPKMLKTAAFQNSECEVDLLGPKSPLGKETSINWRKGELIASGAFGRVYSGLNEDNGSIIAVKEIQFASGDNNEDIAAIVKEVELLRSLSHENIVGYLGTESTVDNTLYILTEWVPGGSLDHHAKKFGGKLSESVVKKYTVQILNGLDYLHANKVIHRDIKGANILINDKGIIKLTDFGASKQMLAGATMAAENQSLCGTPYYMAPEVITQTGHGRKADIWSVGCTVLKLLSGSPPWKSLKFSSPASLMYHIANSKGPPDFPKDLSADARSFLNACFKRDPKKRSNTKELLKHQFLVSKESNLVLSPVKPPRSSKNRPTSPQSSTNASSGVYLPEQFEFVNVPLQQYSSPLVTEDRNSSFIKQDTIEITDTSTKSWSTHEDKPIITNNALLEKQKSLASQIEKEKLRTLKQKQWEAELLEYQKASG